MKVLRGTLAAFFLAAPILLFAAAPAHAALTGTCSASGTLDGKTYNPKTVDKATIPRKGDVHWEGSIPGSGKRPISGSVHVKLPWPIPDQTLGSWGKPSDAYSNSNVYHYDLPSELEGVDIPVYGSHTERGKTCAGFVIVRLDGGGVSNPAVIGAFVVLVISGVGIWVALKPKGA
jgi:hypothetical protein